MNDLELSITVYLKNHCRGKENALSFKSLSLHFQISQREFRRTVSRLVTQGKAAIGTTSRNGYFYVITDEESLHVEKELQKRAVEIFLRKRGFKKARTFDKQFEKYEQPVLLEV